MQESPDRRIDDQSAAAPPRDRLVRKVMRLLGEQLTIDLRSSDSLSLGPSIGAPDELTAVVQVGRRVGIAMTEVPTRRVRDVAALLDDSQLVLSWSAHDQQILITSRSGRQYTVTQITANEHVEQHWSEAQLRQYLSRADLRLLACRREFACEAMAVAPTRDPHHAQHLTPVQRFLALLNLDQRDIRMVIVFALVAGLLTLATPLTIESLVNVVSWGTYLQPLIVLALLLVGCMGLAGVFKVLQAIVVETIQRRQFVRFVGDLAHRFPRANQTSLAAHFPRELANRAFDIMTIQKATATLLLDGIMIVLSTTFGLVLLALYHPFLLGFDLVLCFLMVIVTWILGRGGVRTAIEESAAKYEVIHWLQDVISTPSAFKVNGGEWLASQRAAELTSTYLFARQRQFRVVVRQISFAIALQALASTAILGLGGWLVIRGQLTLGQLVASELVVTVIVGAFAKAGKSLETFYDLLAAIDKVGHLLDIQTDDVPAIEMPPVPNAAIAAHWTDLTLATAHGNYCLPRGQAVAGTQVAIHGGDVGVQRQLARVFAGLTEPASGRLEIAGVDPAALGVHGQGKWVAYATHGGVFHGTLLENVSLGREAISTSRVRECLDEVGLSPDILRMPDGIQTHLQSDGYPLNDRQMAQLLIARCLASHPRFIIIDGLLDSLDRSTQNVLWNAITRYQATVVLVTSDDTLAPRCSAHLSVAST